jgi:Golgi SNAP receptor complex protein 1
LGDSSLSSGGSTIIGGPLSDNDNYSQQSSLLAVDYGVGGTTGSSSTHSSTTATATASTITTTLNKLDNEETALSKDIQRTISQMNELINTKMAPSSECTGKAQHALLVKRYREIVFDCNAEYSKTCASIVRRREAHVTASVSGGNNDSNG